MEENRKAMVLASFLGDSLALGAHWIYDVDEITRRFGRVDRLLNPPKGSYHSTKDVGEFTHYGDQSLVLLESLADSRSFDLDNFARKWKGLFEHYGGYFDHATKDTLANVAGGKGPTVSGSPSSDLAGAARIAPLVFLYADDPDRLVASARAQTAMTHNNPAVIEKAELFARVASAVLQGNSPTGALTEIGRTLYPGSLLQENIERGLDSARLSTREAVLEFGQSCDVQEAFPAVVHCIGRYESNLKEALVENVMAGGDSAARGMLVGMVLGAYLGRQGIPTDWLASLKKRDHILQLLSDLGSNLYS